MKVNMHEAKSQLSKLGELVWKGEKVVIAKAGDPYLDLIPHKPDQPSRKPGRYKDQIVLDDRFNDEMEEINQAFEGDL